MVLGDVPFFSPDSIERLVDADLAEASPIIAPRYDGQRGNPMLFERSQFDRLLSVSGDRGGRKLVRKHPDTVVIDTDDPGVIRDVDTVSDLASTG